MLGIIGIICGVLESDTLFRNPGHRLSERNKKRLARSTHRVCFYQNKFLSKKPMFHPNRSRHNK